MDTWLTYQVHKNLRLDGGIYLGVTPVADDWHALRLGPPVRIAGRTYLCSGIRLHQGPDAGALLYILYPESLWRSGAKWFGCYD